MRRNIIGLVARNERNGCTKLERERSGGDTVEYVEEVK